MKFQFWKKGPNPYYFPENGAVLIPIIGFLKQDQRLTQTKWDNDCSFRAYV